MNNNLTKKEMKMIDTEDLNIRYCRILERAELLDAKDIPVSDAREILYIEDILHERLVKAVGHDFYPPDRIEKKYPSNYMVEILKSKQPKTVKPESEVNNKIKFKITVKSSIGSVVAKKNVSVDTRGEADLLAGELIRDLGIKRATYKIS